MNKLLSFSFGILLFVSVTAQENLQLDTLSKTFTYQGEKLFVKNRFAEGHGFTVKQVWVNGKEVESATNQSVFEVKVENLGLKEGDEVKVDLVHEALRKPVFLGRVKK